jgi:hypothetical protein
MTLILLLRTPWPLIRIRSNILPPLIPFDNNDEFLDLEDNLLDDSHDIIITTTANVCTGFTTVPPSFEENTAFHDLIVDPSQYLSFNA